MRIAVPIVLSLVALATGLHANALEPLATEEAEMPMENVSTNATTRLPPMTLEQKQVADAASSSADQRVTVLEKARDEAWQHARGNLAVASSPPIRSSAVFALLSAETEKFAQLEGAITNAKDEAARKRRMADLSGGAWDALESKRLALLRLQAADAGLTAARLAESKARSNEAELLSELELMKAAEPKP